MKMEQSEESRVIFNRLAAEEPPMPPAFNPNELADAHISDDLQSDHYDVAEDAEEVPDEGDATSSPEDLAARSANGTQPQIKPLPLMEC